MKASRERITMIGIRTHATIVLAFVILAAAGIGSMTASTPGSPTPQNTPDSGRAPQVSSPLQGTWSGSFFSKHASPGFTLTVVITPDSRGHLVGESTLSSNCLKGTKLQVTTMGSKVTLAGSDQEGDSLTIHGTLDSTGSLMQATYILNGSASGNCETDDGTGNLGKR
jgi:hypothetical protein